MSIKISFLSIHLDYFPDNFVDYSVEQRGYFPQDIATIEDRYQGNVTVNIIDGHC